MTSREFLTHRLKDVAAFSLPAAALVYSRLVNPNGIAALVGGHIQRANIEHGLRGFVYPWMGAAMAKFFVPALESDPRKANEATTAAVVGFALINLLTTVLPVELVTEPQLLNRPIQWDQVGSEIAGTALAIISERIYRHFSPPILVDEK